MEEDLKKKWMRTSKKIKNNNNDDLDKIEDDLKKNMEDNLKKKWKTTSSTNKKINFNRL